MMIRTFFTSVFTALTLLVSATAPAVSDLAKDDIQVLLAGSYGPSVSVSGAQSSNTFDLTACDLVSASSYYHTYDCTSQLEQMTGRPAMERVLVGANVQPGGYIVSSYYCRVLTVRTVLLTEAANSPVFTGIGFWSSQGGGTHLVPKDGLKEVGTATLKDGRPVLVHEFIGTALCWQGSATSSMRAQYRFKPFAAYDTGAETYQVWENVATDHAISSSFAAWDRTADLLQ